MIAELGVILLSTSIIGLSARDQSMNPETKLRHLFENTNMVLGKGRKIYRPRVIHKNDTVAGKHYVFSILPGQDVTWFEKRRQAIEAVFGGKRITLYTIDGHVHMDVIENELPGKIPWEDEVIQKACEGKDIPVVVGFTLDRKLIVVDLKDLPHLLIGAPTGYGKSTILRGFARTLSWKDPGVIRVHLIDPKRSEFIKAEYGESEFIETISNDLDEVLKLLEVMEKEYLWRQKLLEKHQCRDIQAFNKRARVPLPYRVILIDEVSSFSVKYAAEENKKVIKAIEAKLVFLTEKGRHAGIHLIMAAQRPVVDVVNGQIKGNCPARIAFAMADEASSKVILDNGSATDIPAIPGRGIYQFSNTHVEFQAPVAPRYKEEINTEPIENFSGSPFKKLPEPPSFSDEVC